MRGIVDGTKLRAWWWHRQGLDGSLMGRSPSEILARAGWARSVGGVNPYLTLFARGAISRAAADKAVASLEIHELPSTRGCTYVLPAADFPLALTLSQGFTGDMNTARKLGVTDKEVDRLSDKVLGALAKGPLDPDALREAAGRAVRSLGEAGKKKGVTTTLPLALGRLQSSGDIRRVPVNGRLDQQRYRYALWRPNPLAKFKLSGDEAYIELARRFFRWIGPATAAEFQWFSALGVKAGKAAIEPLELAPFPEDPQRLMFANDLAEYKRFKPGSPPRGLCAVGWKAPSSPQYALVSGLDSMALLRRDHVMLLDEADAKRKVLAERGLEEMGGLSDLPNHAILERGRLVGLWEFDPESQKIAWMTFGKKDKALMEAVERTEAFVRDDLGDARSFSLDSPKSRAPKIAALRKAAAA